MTLKKIGTTLGIIAGVITLLGMAYSYDASLAKASDLKAVIIIVQDMKLNDRLHDLQKRLWSIEDRYRDKTNMSKDDRDECRTLKQEIVIIRRQLDIKENTNEL
jgi:hypothetical protein